MNDTGYNQKRSALDRRIDTIGDGGDRTLVQFFRKRSCDKWSAWELGERVNTMARHLCEELDPGSVVVLLGEDRPEWILAALAIMRAGMVVAPLDVQLDDDHLKHILKDSGASQVFTTKHHRSRIEAAEMAGDKIWLLDTDSDEGDASTWRSLIDTPRDETQLPDNRGDDTVALFYTSGTTGPPKGVPLSHANLAFQLDTIREADIVRDGDRVLLPLPMHHVYPFVVGMLAPLALGLTLVIPYALTGPQIMHAIREGNATTIIGVPRLYQALYDGIRTQARRKGRFASGVFHVAFVLSRFARRRLRLRLGKWLLQPVHRQLGKQLRLAASGGSALDEDLAWNLEALGWHVAIGYGLTETSPLLTLKPPQLPRFDTVGKAVYRIELDIDKDAAPEDRAKQGEGEILARGPGVFAGYHRQHEKTAEAFTEDGWYRTGDMGYCDEDGYLHVTGRVSTLLVTSGGENIQPDTLEARYQRHDAIDEIGVLMDGDDLVAVVVPAHGVDRDKARDQIGTAIDEIGNQLPSYQRLSDFVMVRQPLPRTRLGKVQRHKLEDRYKEVRDKGEQKPQREPMATEDMNAEDRTLLQESTAKATWAWLAERFPEDGLTPDSSPQLDLGIDSMQWLELTMELGQRAGVDLDDEAIGRIETVRDLLQEVVEASEQSTADIHEPLEHPAKILDGDQRRWLQPRGPLLLGTARVLHTLIRPSMRGLFKLKVEGVDKLPNERPIVLAATHASNLDPFAIAAALPFEQLRSLYWGGWTGIAFSNPVYRFFSRASQAIPIDPERGIKTSMALAAAVLKQGDGLIWFPEGERSPTGQLQEFRLGIGMLLENNPVNVVPISIRGAYEAMPRGQRIPRPNAIKLRFGEPVHTNTLKQEGRGDDDAKRIVDALHNRIRRFHERTD